MLRGYLFAATAVTIWSGFILVSRYGGISPLSAYDIIAIRYAVCAFLLAPVWWFFKPFKILDWRLISCGLIGGLAYALCAFQGFQNTPASHAAILLPGSMPLFIVLLNLIGSADHVSPAKWLGVGIITAGIACLLWSEMRKSGIDGGHWWLVAAAMCWAVFSILIKHWQLNPWQATVSLALVTATAYLPVYICFINKNIQQASWGDILLQGFYQGFMATIVQMLCYVQAVRHLGPTTMGAMMAAIPLIAGLSAVALFDESLTNSLLISLSLVCVGIWITANYSSASRAIAKAQSTTTPR